jgi:cyclomaltodextrinase
MKLGIYKHHSNLIVLVIGVARHSETDERLIAYIPLGVKKGPRITVRPYQAFFETIQKNGKAVPRFEYIGEDMPEDLATNYSPLSQ